MLRSFVRFDGADVAALLCVSGESALLASNLNLHAAVAVA